MYENTFYGVMFGGLLSWVSIGHSFYQPKIFDYVILLLIIMVWFTYGAFFIRS